MLSVVLQDPAAADLSVALCGVSVREAACFLRLIYSPEDAMPASLAALAGGGELAAVAGLAHKLNAGRLLAKIDSFLQGTLLFAQLGAQSQYHVGIDLPGCLPADCLPADCLPANPPARPPPSHLPPPPRVSAFLPPPASGTAPQGSMKELLAALQLARHCQLQQLEEQCLQLAADRLAAVGGHWEAFVGEDDLAALDSATLARLLGKTLQSTQGGRHPAHQLFDVQQKSDAAGGFTFAIAGFSGERDIIRSPWVEVDGFEWRLDVYPGGRHGGLGTHVSGDRHGMPVGAF